MVFGIHHGQIGPSSSSPSQYSILVYIDHFSQGDLKVQKYEVLSIIVVSVPCLSFYPAFIPHQNLKLFLAPHGHNCMASKRVMERIMLDKNLRCSFSLYTSRVHCKLFI